LLLFSIFRSVSRGAGAAGAAAPPALAARGQRGQKNALL